MEDQILSPEKFWMKNSYNRKIIYLNEKNIIWPKYFLLYINLFRSNKNIFWYPEKSDSMKKYFTEYKYILVE